MGLNQDLETGCRKLTIVHKHTCTYSLRSGMISLYKVIGILSRNYTKNFDYMLEIDISGNYFTQNLGVLRSNFSRFGCPKDTLLALTMMEMHPNVDCFIYFRLRVRGQHTKTTGRRGRTVGVSKKK